MSTVEEGAISRWKVESYSTDIRDLYKEINSMWTAYSKQILPHLQLPTAALM